MNSYGQTTPISSATKPKHTLVSLPWRVKNIINEWAIVTLLNTRRKLTFILIMPGCKKCYCAHMHICKPKMNLDLLKIKFLDFSMRCATNVYMAGIWILCCLFSMFRMFQNEKPTKSHSAKKTHQLIYIFVLFYVILHLENNRIAKATIK